MVEVAGFSVDELAVAAELAVEAVHKVAVAALVEFVALAVEVAVLAVEVADLEVGVGLSVNAGHAVEVAAGLVADAQI